MKQILEVCDICGATIDIMPGNQGFNARVKEITPDITPFKDKGHYMPEVWIYPDCWDYYLKLLNLKATWYVLVLVKKIYNIFYKDIDEIFITRCSYCNERFNRKHGNKKYCSDECAKAARKEYKRQHAREYYRKKKIYNRNPITCKRCGLPIQDDHDENGNIMYTHGNQ